MIDRLHKEWKGGGGGEEFDICFCMTYWLTILPNRKRDLCHKFVKSLMDFRASLVKILTPWKSGLNILRLVHLRSGHVAEVT